ncbi:hypothetical protein [Methylobacterium haplocladii]|uniref:High-potential iron-sulfur protein n=1 Tax=Methylobacterium haplocladii TaxID=1176176 RepID=A0A512IS32_9HYPH|nr:hypothetical protein [Methylobacterium haplocladii]GEP00525.1 hypothetical protein MHA02_29120 [Methylobacterium haplocladii]GJD85440.1 hypothetical protein HPGCJGGD_3329 [Methylobacterium haplocladii]GLS57825.1 hypothetical protein GCM10007887_04810 [Methylobacterium haplocladii]
MSARLRPSRLNGLATLAMVAATAVLAAQAPTPVVAKAAPLDPMPEPPAPPNVSLVRPEDVPALGLTALHAPETCAACRFYMPVTSKGGECRRFAPTFGETVAGEWPVTLDKHWCGEFSPAVVPTAH